MSEKSMPMSDGVMARGGPPQSGGAPGDGGGRALMVQAPRQGDGAFGSLQPVTLPSRPSILPTAGAVIQAGAFGAALSGVTTAVTNAMMVKAGQMTVGDAAKDASKAAVQGAATMAVAATVAHAVRARPVIGLAVLAVAGVGLFMMMTDKKKAKTASASRKAAPAADPAEAAVPPTASRRNAARKSK